MAETFELRLDEIRAAYDKRNNSVGDLNAYRDLMYDNLKRLISFLAKKWSYKAKGNHLAAVEDLVQEAVVVMMEGLDQYDPYISNPSTYFLPRFEAQMKKLSNEYPIKISDYYLDAIAETDKVLKENGFRNGINDPDVTIDLIVDVMDIPVKRAKMIYELSRREYSSLEDPDYIEKKSEITPEDSFLAKEDKNSLVSACSKLTKLEQFVIQAVLFEHISYRTIVSMFKKNDELLDKFSLDKRQVTGKFIKQIESKALRKLRGVVRKPIAPGGQDSIYIQASEDDVMDNIRNEVLVL